MEPVIIVVAVIIAMLLVTKREDKTDKSLIVFGNLTGSGLPLDYVKAHLEKFPLSSFSGGVGNSYSGAHGGTGGKFSEVSVQLTKDTQ